MVFLWMRNENDFYGANLVGRSGRPAVRRRLLKEVSDLSYSESVLALGGAATAGARISGFRTGNGLVNYSYSEDRLRG